MKGSLANLNKWNTSNTSFCLFSFVNNVRNTLHRVLCKNQSFIKDVTFRSSCTYKTSKDEEYQSGVNFRYFLTFTSVNGLFKGNLNQMINKTVISTPNENRILF